MSESDEKAVRLGLPAAEHAKLRVLAAQSGMSMSEYARTVVLKAIGEGYVHKPPAPAKKDKDERRAK